MKTAALTITLLLLIVGLVLLATPAFSQGLTDDQKVLHVANRLSYGLAPGDLDRIRAQGVKAYIQAQLHPDSLALPATLNSELAKLSTLKMSALDLIRTFQPERDAKKAGDEDKKDKREQRRENSEMLMDEAITARLLSTTQSPRQLEEKLVDFWFNHFNVFIGKGMDRLLVGNYVETAIRPHVLGKFRDLLGATAHHPAMLFYLDNILNTAPGSPGARGRYEGLNENYARELMELHTLGVNGGYTQDDVIALARILTGWGLPFRGPRQLKEGKFASSDPSGFYFDASRHDTGDKVLLGTTIKSGGVREGELALDLLARHPSTAKFVCVKLAQYFVSDQPPQALVDRMAATFLQSDGDIRQVLTTLFDSPEFWDAAAYQAKFKTPYQYLISAFRATGAEIPDGIRVNQLLRQWGMPLFGKLTPDGYKNTQEAWLSPDALVKRVSFAAALAAGRIGQGPKGAATPVDAESLKKTLGPAISQKTLDAAEISPDRLDAGLILGGPDFMKY